MSTGYATTSQVGAQQVVPQSYTSNVSAWMPTNKYEIKAGQSQVETLAKDRVWTEYEAVQKTEYVPIERRAQDLYQIEHVTEMHPQVKYETKVDYVPQTVTDYVTQKRTDYVEQRRTEYVVNKR